MAAPPCGWFAWLYPVLCPPPSVVGSGGYVAAPPLWLVRVALYGRPPLWLIRVALWFNHEVMKEEALRVSSRNIASRLDETLVSATID